MLLLSWRGGGLLLSWQGGPCAAAELAGGNELDGAAELAAGSGVVSAGAEPAGQQEEQLKPKVSATEWRCALGCHAEHHSVACSAALALCTRMCVYFFCHTLDSISLVLIPPCARPSSQLLTCAASFASTQRKSAD